MTMKDLQDELRSQVRARIGRGELTGSELARNAELPQGHLSNFLNSRRGLSLDSMDRLLGALGIDVLDLMRVQDMERRMQMRRRGAPEAIVVVAAHHAALPRFTPEQVLDTRSFNRSFLSRQRPRAAVDRSDWLRFVVVKLDRHCASGFFPRSTTTTLLVDRHYSSLQPYRRTRPNLYVVSLSYGCVAAYVSMCENCLMLRPREPRQPIEVIPIERGRTYADYIVGRVCHVGLEV